MKKIFIDGSVGTTGLRIFERLSNRTDVSLMTLSEEKRKVASVSIKHGLPGYIVPSEVADDPRQKVRRPSPYFAKTRNAARTITTVFPLDR